MATFTISSTVCTFGARIIGSSQEAGDVERLVVGMYLTTAQEWLDAVALATTKYHIHVPLGGNIVIDVVRGAGTGTLVIAGLGTTTALLTDLRRQEYLPSPKSLATCAFLLTAAWS